ncbi:MAG TPA: nitrilase-related carbon-nitrogen hydrolase [Thermoanaerobaculia bacterium]|nr:nitrilase-related carbon-nitrogen hydrolase [Thermoanaerobaculia bacterium]
MSETGATLTVGLAQIDCRPGDPDANLAHHLEWVERARAAGVDLLVFPELSLTGYRLLHLTPRLARRVAGDPDLARLAAAAGPMAVLAGLVEEGEDGRIFNSAVLLGGAGGSGADSAGQAFVHRKLYLPTYGLFQEGRFFRPGSRLAAAPLAAAGAAGFGILVCEDLWHPHLAGRLAAAGVRLLAVPSAGPGRLGPGPVPPSHESWELVTRSTALLNATWVLYCNRVGWEEGTFYSGGSHVVRPGGEVLARAPFLEEHLLTVTIDLREADRLRWRLPLLADERADVQGVVRELEERDPAASLFGPAGSTGPARSPGSGDGR